MKTKLILAGVVAAALAIAIPFTTFAAGWRGHHGGPGPGQAGMLLRLADKLNLSQDQRTQVKLVIDQTRQAVQPLRQQLQANRQAFRAAHDPAAFDETAVREQFHKQAAIREEIAVARGRAIAQGLAVLTPDQRTQLAQMRAQRAAKYADPGGGESGGPDEE